MPLLENNPNVNVRVNPDRFIESLVQMNQDRKTNAIARERLIFDRAAPQRVVEAAAAKRKLLNDRAQVEQGIIESSGGSLANQFFNDPKTKAIFEANPEFAGDEAKQLQFINSLAGKNKKQFSDPKVYGDTIFKGVLNQGGTLGEAEAAKSRAVSNLFPSLSADMAKALFQKVPNSTINLSNAGRSSGSSGATRLLSSIAGETQDAKLSENFINKFKIKGDRFTIPFTDYRPFDVGDQSVSKSDLLKLEGEFSTELRPATVRATLGSLMDASDGTSTFDINNMTSTDRKDFLALGQAVERKRNETQGSSSSGSGRGLSFAELQTAQADQQKRISIFNNNILGRTSPQTNPYSDRVGILRNALGLSDKSPDTAVVKKLTKILQDPKKKAQIETEVAGTTEPAVEAEAPASFDDFISSLDTGKPALKPDSVKKRQIGAKIFQDRSPLWKLIGPDTKGPKSDSDKDVAAFVNAEKKKEAAKMERIEDQSRQDSANAYTGGSLLDLIGLPKSGITGSRI